MIGLDNKERRIEAERIAESEIRIVNENPLVIRPNCCAACHVLFMIANKMKISEQMQLTCFQRCFLITIN
jgi:hypothetical protein